MSILLYTKVNLDIYKLNNLMAGVTGQTEYMFKVLAYERAKSRRRYIRSLQATVEKNLQGVKMIDCFQ